MMTKFQIRIDQNYLNLIIRISNFTGINTSCFGFEYQQVFSRFTPKVFHLPQFGQRPDQSVVLNSQLEQI
jgi:hypothetical protein